MDRTVLFCVGATKAGTSWLHRYLSDHPDCHFRSIKELHFFDALERNSIPAQLEQNLIASDALRVRIADAPASRVANLSRQINDRDNWQNVLNSSTTDVSEYLGYLNTGATDETVVGDITPAYGLLSEDRLRMMSKIAPDTRFIYVLRDPIARLWSHVRMIAVRRSDDGELKRGRVNRIFDRTINGREDHIADRSDYKSTLQKLAAAIDVKKLLIVFYEDLFKSDALGKICSFLGIRTLAGDLDHKIHTGQPMKMLDEQRQRARVWLAEQYEFVQASVGNPPASWQYELAKVQS